MNKIFEKSRSLVILFILGFALVSCGDQEQADNKASGKDLSPNKSQKLNVVTTFTILEDITRNIARDRVNIINIVGYDADPHVYSPTPDIAKKLCSADLIIQNGLGFEGWIERLIKSSCYVGDVVTASKGISVSYMDCDCKNHIISTSHREKNKLLDGHALNHQHGDIHKIDNIDDKDNQKFIDPHAWGDVRNVIIYARNIKDALIKIDPVNKIFYEENYLDYKKKLESLDMWIEEQFKRAKCNGVKVITAHDAFFYFGKRYNIEFIALQGISTESTPSAKDIAKVIDVIRNYHISAIFSENISNSRLITQVAKEAGVKIGGELYSDSLSRDKKASTYIDMMKYNVSLITKTLCF